MLGEPQQTVDQRGQIPQAGFQMTLDPMIQLFGVEQLGHPTQIRFDRKALVPRPALAALDIERRRVFLAQAEVGQRNRLAVIAGRQWTKDVVGTTCSGSGHTRLARRCHHR